MPTATQKSAPNALAQDVLLRAVKSHVEHLAACIDVLHSNGLLATAQDMELDLKELQSAIKAHEAFFSQEGIEPAYRCNGCGHLYQDKDICCDCMTYGSKAMQSTVCLVVPVTAP